MKYRQKIIKLYPTTHTRNINEINHETMVSNRGLSEGATSNRGLLEGTTSNRGVLEGMTSNRGLSERTKDMIWDRNHLNSISISDR